MSHKRILVTGGAGFLGVNLCKALVKQDNYVVCFDDPSIASQTNLLHMLDFEKEVPNLRVEFGDVRSHYRIRQLAGWHFDQIYHLACPASPPKYQKDPIGTMLTNVVGTNNLLDLADGLGAKILFTSTSEIYGDPEVHPQTEEYRGNVSVTGPRACYDEGKRAAEALVWDYKRVKKTEVRVARIFNTYGPHMDIDDGRLVTNFIRQLLKGEPMTIYGDGQQTRSLCYVDDQINGLMKLMELPFGEGPINIGNPEEHSIEELALKIYKTFCHESGFTVTKAPLKFVSLPQDDPKVRRPDITKAKNVLGWEPTVTVDQGLQKTIKFYLEQGVV